MSYIGSTPTTQSFIAGTDSFNGTGSATNFTLSRFVNSVNDIQVMVNNVVQYPPNYSVSGNTLTISPAPSSGTNNVYVRYLSTTLQSITVPGGSSVVGNFGLSGNLQFLGSAQRITGDFNNSTIANRVAFQTSTVDNITVVSAIPNGTAQQSNFEVYNKADPSPANNPAMGQALINSSEFSLRSSIRGSGTYLPMTFYTGGSERARIATNGDFSFNSGYGSSAVAYGCRAWVNFNGTGTVAIRGSANVSSITDTGTGDYTVNFTTAMPDANYCTNVTGTHDSGSYVAWGTVANDQPPTTTNVNVDFLTTNGTLTDVSFAEVSIFR